MVIYYCVNDSMDSKDLLDSGYVHEAPHQVTLMSTHYIEF